MDRLSKEKRSWNMSRIRSKDTKPELMVRRFLFKQGYRYRVNYKLKGKPDIVFPGYRIAIFIHGCFWHRHNCKNFVMPKTNTDFWKNKIEGNVARDLLVAKKLKADSWKIRVIWECELEKNRDHTLLKLENFINKNS